MTNLFDKINEDLFKPLANSHRREYIDIIMILWKICEKDPMHSIDKEEAVDEIERYLLQKTNEVKLEEEEEEEIEQDETLKGGQNARNIGTYLFRTLRTQGWLIEIEPEFGERLRVEINNTIIPILDAFVKIIEPKTITYSGKLYKIYISLKGIKNQKTPYQKGLKEGYNDIKEFNKMLSIFLSSIKSRIKELTHDKDPLEIIKLLEKYEEECIDIQYQHFKTDNNIFRYRQELMDIMYQCYDDVELFNALIKDYMIEEDVEEEEAKREITNIILSMREQIQKIAENMKLIDREHQSYIRKAVQRANFLASSDNTSRDKLNKILQYYVATMQSEQDLYDIDDTIAKDLFDIYEQQSFDEESIKAPYKRKASTPIDDINIDDAIDPQLIKQEQRKLLEYMKNAPTQENINRFADKILVREQSILASDLLKKNPKDFVKIMGLSSYQQTSDRHYDIELLDNEVTVCGITFKDFIIKTKKQVSNK